MTRAPVWLWGGLALAIPLVLPFAVVAASAFAPAGEAWAHLAATVRPDYVSTTLVLLLTVAAGVVANADGALCSTNSSSSSARCVS